MLCYDTSAAYEFLQARIPGLQRTEDAIGIGWTRGGVISAAAVFEHFNGMTVWAHVAVDGRLSRQFLDAFLAYPFAVGGVESLRGLVLASNLKLRRLAKHLGAEEEAVLARAAPDGGDVLICTLWRGNRTYVPLAP